MNFMQINKCDTMNGEGVRVSVWPSGCRHNCKGCYNKEAQNFKAGELWTLQHQEEVLIAASETHVAGLSILGGDGCMPQNIETVTKLCRAFKQHLPRKTIWLWTGYTFSEIEHLEIIQYLDVVIDGKYVEELNVKGEWWGSSNQKMYCLK